MGLVLYDIQARIAGRPGDSVRDDVCGVARDDVCGIAHDDACGVAYDSAHDPLLPLLVLRSLLPQLIGQVAALLFDAELDALFAPLPPQARAALRVALAGVGPPDPERRLRSLRKLIRSRTNAR